MHGSIDIIRGMNSTVVQFWLAVATVGCIHLYVPHVSLTSAFGSCSSHIGSRYRVYGPILSDAIVR